MHATTGKYRFDYEFTIRYILFYCSRLFKTGIKLACSVVVLLCLVPAHAGQIGPNPNNGTIDTDLTIPYSTDWNNVNFTNNGTVNLYSHFNNNSVFDNNGWVWVAFTDLRFTNTTGAVLNNNVNGKFEQWASPFTNQAGATVNNSGSFRNRNVFDNYGTLINNPGGYFLNAGNLNNYAGGTITNNGSYEGWALTIYGGSVDNNSQWQNRGNLLNRGTFNNNAGGVMNNTDNGSIRNESVFNNAGTITNDSGRTIENVGGTFNNSGILNNSGTLRNSGTLNNTGTLTNNSGATFINDGTFSNTGAFTNLGTLMGTGTITGNISNSGRIAPGQSIGTMTINGDYVHNAGGVYQAEVNAAGQSDKLNISGTAALNGGTVVVVASSGNYNAQTSYTILTAGSITGAFGNVTSNLAFLTPSLSYDQTNVYLRLSRNSFTSAAATQNQNNVAESVEMIYANSPTGDMSTVMSALLGLSLPEARDAYNQMSALVHTAVGEVTFSSLNRYMGTMTARMNKFSMGGPSSELATQPVMFASRDSVADSTNMILAALGRTDYGKVPSWGFWAQGYGDFGNRYGDDISSRYRYDSSGAVFGFDRKITDYLLLGASVGYSYGNVRMKDLSNYAGVSSYQAALYGIYNGKPLYLSSILAYGLNRYNTRRDISFDGLNRTANADYNAHSLGAYLESGYKVETAVVTVIPMVSLTGAYIMRDSFTERDGDALNINADSESASYAQSSVGLKLNREFAVQKGKLIPQFQISWDHRLSSDRLGLNASFTGYPAYAFASAGEMPDRDSLGLGIGLTWQIRDNLEFNISYNGNFSADNTQQGGVLGMQYRW